MITYHNGSLLQADAEAVINTVNTVGVMGKGLALQFAKDYPQLLRAYKAACRQGHVTTGKMWLFKAQPYLIINFPTKASWRNPSQYSYIEQGLDDLILTIRTHGLTSIAIPPLGCGNGGLHWPSVHDMILYKLQDLPNLHIQIYGSKPLRD